jgi:cell division septum initiation protein DivIVA
MKRENNELNTRIKQLDAEIKRGAKQATTMGNEDVCVTGRISFTLS